ncbi:MAG: HEAT repeat domain-containing protein, partial [Planctomycetes bacterium]|nr:HEAT repeat domain-containing protein [Planctomycetota bacterium]
MSSLKIAWYGRTLRKSGDPDARRDAVRELQLLDDPRAVEHLAFALNDKKWRVRWAATRALAELGDRRAVEQLSLALRRESSA